MQRIWTTAQVRAAEDAALASTPAGALMRRAAFGVAVQARRLLLGRSGGVAGRRVTLLVGAGNNGGDALWAGAELRRRGVAVTAVLLDVDRAHRAGLAALRRTGGRVVDAAAEPALARDRVCTAELVIDGIVGISARGPLRPSAAELVDAAADGGVPILAVDLPSGVNPDTGVVDGPAVSAAATVTFGARKPVHVLAPHRCGPVYLVDIGVGPYLDAGGDPHLYLPELADVAARWPVPGRTDDKYTQGVVGVAAGSAVYPGAAVLATGAAVLATSGMVRYAGPAADAVRDRWPEVIAAASVEQGDVLARYLELGGGPGIRTSHRLTDAAALAGLDESLFRRLWLASGLRDQNDASEADIEMLRVAAGALEAGMPIDALLQIIRVLNDSLTRVAEAENRLFHYYVHERLRAEGLAGAALVAATEEVSGPLLGLMEPALLYFHSKAWQRALRDDLVVHLAEDVGGAGDAIGQVSVTVLFIDLARYTAMTEAMGDLAVATVIERFSDLVREAASGYDGRVLLQVGDEFMPVFRDSPSAISCGLSVMAMTAREAQFPDVRLGAHAGPALYREGDYVGATINLAARVTSEAERGQFLVTESMKLADPDGTVSFVSVGLRSMKNVGEPVELFEV
ncbi:MAG: NAD(P)H-hydrate epimerase, partial [Pseudonocardiales bacterium]|nr:NAD(P)H-hydrate epimerase [Pseudonocardiales bacterium]